MFERPELIQAHRTRRNGAEPLKAILVCLITFLLVYALAGHAHAATVEIGIAPGESEPVVTFVANPYQMLIDNMTEDEKAVLKRIIWAEANNQSIEGQRACIEVCLNRMLSNNDWGQKNGIIGVLSKKGQFATWKSRNKVKSNADQDLALELVYTEEPILPSTKYVYFDRRGVNGRNHVKIGAHYFGAEK